MTWWLTRKRRRGSDHRAAGISRTLNGEKDRNQKHRRGSTSPEAWILREVERLLEFMEKHGLEEFEYERDGVRVRLKKAVGASAGRLRTLRAAAADRERRAAGSACEQAPPARAGDAASAARPRRAHRGSSRDQIPDRRHLLRLAEPGRGAIRQGRRAGGVGPGALHHRSDEADERDRVGRGGRSRADFRRERPAGGIRRAALRHPPASARNSARGIGPAPRSSKCSEKF